MKVVLIGIAMITLISFGVKDLLTGRWETKPSGNGNVTGVVFKADNSFEGYINKKPFVTGTYTLEGDVFTFSDNGCDGMKGVYRIIFFSNSDSLRFEPVSDSCAQRKNGMSRLIMGKVKKINL
jgi:hypothetical protein